MKSDAIALSEVALAQATQSPVDMSALGQWPVLQFFAALLTLAGGAYAIFRGMNKTVSPAIAPAFAQAPPYEFPNVYLQGPMTQAISLCQEIRNIIQETKGVLERIEQAQYRAAEKIVQQSILAERNTHSIERNNELLVRAVQNQEQLITLAEQDARRDIERDPRGGRRG